MIYLYAASLHGAVEARAQTTAVQDGRHSLSVSAEARTERHTYLKVRLELDLDSLRPGRKEARVFTPVLSDGEHRQALRPIVVNGRWRHLMYLRKLEGRGEDEYVVQGGRHIGTTTYEDSCLYRPWMKEAGVWLAKDLCGCGGEPMEQSLRLLAKKVEVTEEKDMTGSVAQQTVSVAASPMTDTASENRHRITRVTLYLDYLTFPLDRTELLPDFGNNRKELQKLDNALDSLLTRPRCRIEVVDINGYASPDGPYPRNDELAYGRTLALRNYLQGIRRYRELPFRTASVAEDWQWLKTALEKSDMPYREELLMIINTSLTHDEKEANMKRLDGGRAYRILKRDFLPQLRRTVCEIHYIQE
ncbi:MAG: hypothetical protein LUE99_07330 [Bacteroides sp.]|nr:hypothetical protein [Bacteroides sp.]